MIEFALGGLAVAILYTFFPDLAVIPAGAVRKYGPKLWERIRRRNPKE